MAETMTIPLHVKYFMGNWTEGYDFGIRDARRQNPMVTNFSAEKHGFMSGYIVGFSDGTEKKKGRNAALRIIADFTNGIANCQIIPESDRQGETESERKETIKRWEERAKIVKAKEKTI